MRYNWLLLTNFTQQHVCSWMRPTGVSVKYVQCLNTVLWLTGSSPDHIQPAPGRIHWARPRRWWTWCSQSSGSTSSSLISDPPHPPSCHIKPMLGALLVGNSVSSKHVLSWDWRRSIINRTKVSPHLKITSSMSKWYSMIPVVGTRTLRMSCSVGR